VDFADASPPDVTTLFDHVYATPPPACTAAAGDPLSGEGQHDGDQLPAGPARHAPRRTATDENVFLIGEEIGVFEGSYKITAGLLAEFGPRRVRDTPICEEGFTGVAIGPR